MRVGDWGDGGDDDENDETPRRVSLTPSYHVSNIVIMRESVRERVVERV